MNDTNVVPMVETMVAKLSKVCIPTAVLRTGFQGTEDTIRGFKPFNLYIPEGSKYEVRDATDDEKQAFAHIREKHDPSGNVPDVQQVIHFPVGWMYAKRTDADRIPMPIIFHTGVNVYVASVDDMRIVPDRHTPLEWANLMVTDADTDVPMATIEGEPGEMPEGFRAMTLMMALNLLMRRQKKAAGKHPTKSANDKALYGDECTYDERDPEAHGYALVDALRFMGEPRAALVTQNGDTLNMRTFHQGGLYVAVPPGSQIKRKRMDEEEINAIIGQFNGSGCDLKPVEYLMIENAAMLDRQEGEDKTGDYQIAIGDMTILLEAGVEVQNTTAWVPKLPFDSVGVTDYLDLSPKNPGRAAMEKALDNVQHTYTVEA